MTVNQNIAKAYAIKHQQQLRAAMSSENPVHAKHVQAFCDYTDAVVAAAIDGLREAIPAMIQAELSRPSVQIKVDEKSYQVARKKIDDLFKGIWKLWR